jgi:hypothetical protein
VGQFLPRLPTLSSTRHASTTHQFRSLRRAAEVFNIPYTLLTRRYYRITYYLETRNARYKLTATKEQTIIQYILNLDSRGFAPQLCKVADIADKVLGIRSSKLVSKY